MANRILALSCAVSISLLASADGQAQTMRPINGADGCAILAGAVHQQLTASARPAYDKRVPHAGGTDVVICNQTARTVSAAFTKAMATMNVYVSWRDPRDVRGDFCLSANLSQCYPHRSPYIPIADIPELAFVYASWSAVQATTLKHAEAGGFNDTTRFSPAVLKSQLRRSIKKASAVSRRRSLP